MMPARVTPWRIRTYLLNDTVTCHIMPYRRAQSRLADIWQRISHTWDTVFARGPANMPNQARHKLAYQPYKHLLVHVLSTHVLLP